MLRSGLCGLCMNVGCGKCTSDGLLEILSREKEFPKKGTLVLLWISLGIFTVGQVNVGPRFGPYHQPRGLTGLGHGGCAAPPCGREWQLAYKESGWGLNLWCYWEPYPVLFAPSVILRPYLRLTQSARVGYDGLCGQLAKDLCPHLEKSSIRSFFGNQSVQWQSLPLGEGT